MLEGKRLVQMTGCRFEVDIKVIRIRTLRDGIVHLAHNVARSCEHNSDSSGCTKREQISW
jgi:hypothetical protein